MTVKDTLPTQIPIVTSFFDIVRENVQQLQGPHITFGQFDLKGGRSHDYRGVAVTLEKSLET